VKEDPLSNSGDGLLCLIERRQLRLEAVLGESHACCRYHEKTELLKVTVTRAMQVLGLGSRAKPSGI
jgi:hypothetical protein